MARLQLPPQNTNRSRLLTQVAGLPTPAPSRPIAVEGGTSPRIRQPKNDTSSDGTDVQSFRTPETTFDNGFFDGDDSVLDIDEIDEIDLTGENPTTSSFGDFGTPVQLWEENAASRVDPPVKRGRKRKSEEYQQDAMSPNTRSARRGGKRPAAPSPLADMDIDDDFHATQDTARPGHTHRHSLGLDEPRFEVQRDVSPPPKVRPKLIKSETAPSQLGLVQHGDVVPDSDEEDLLSPVKKSRSSPIPPQNNLGLHDVPAYNDAHIKVQPESSANESKLNVPKPELKASSTPVDFTRPAPTPDVIHTLNGISQPQALADRLVKLSDSQKAVVSQFIAAESEQLQTFIQRLEASWKATNREIAEQIAEEGEAPVGLKAKKKTIAQRLEASKQVLAHRQAYEIVLGRKEEKKRRLNYLLDEGHDPDTADENSEITALCVEIRKLKSQGDAQELTLFQQLQLAGLSNSQDKTGQSMAQETSSPSLALQQSNSGVLVASTQKAPFGSPHRAVHLSPSRSQSVIQTPMAETRRRYDDFAQLDFDNSRRAQSPALRPSPSRVSAPSFAQPSTSRSMRPPDPTIATRDFTTNMGSPPRTTFSADDFDDFIEDDEDMIDAANAFERDYATAGPSHQPATFSRPPLSNMSDNIRRVRPGAVSFERI